MKRPVFLRIAAIAAILFALGSAAAPAQLIYPGEELTYEVSYMGITLGTIKTIMEQPVMLDGVKCQKVKVFINSHPNIPFVSLHSVYESWMDTTLTFSRKFTANTMVEDDKWEFDQYLFDYPNNKLTMETFRDKKKTVTKTVDIKRKYNDGSSILFAARRLLRTKKTVRVPTVIMQDTVNTAINFRGTIQSREISAVDYPVRTVFFDGNADWTGIYGLTGRFEGWFSDDEAQIPIYATMKLYVGSVSIELVKWKRGNWAPPKAS